MLNVASYAVLMRWEPLIQHHLWSETPSPPAFYSLKKFFPCLLASFHQHLHMFKSLLYESPLSFPGPTWPGFYTIPSEFVGCGCDFGKSLKGVTAENTPASRSASPSLRVWVAFHGIQHSCLDPLFQKGRILWTSKFQKNIRKKKKTSAPQLQLV